MQSEFVVEATLWKYQGPAAWFFVSIPLGVGNQIRPHAPKVGFGSVRVKACVGTTRWKTSLFPDKATGSYLLPVKADVRRREGLQEGDRVLLFLEL